MGLLGTLLLIFLIVHISKFWVASRFTGIPTEDVNGNHDLFALMVVTFQNPILVAFYVLSMFSLAYHLLHGFKSAFQTLGWNHKKYNGVIKGIGVWYSILISLIFAAMPLAIYFRLIH